MTDMWTIVLVVLLAVLTGALVPTLVQLQWTLRAARRTLANLEGRLAKSLDGVDRASAQIVRVGKEAEQATSDVRKVSAAVASLGESLDEVGGSLKRAASLVSAVTPAVVAAVNAFVVARDRTRAAHRARSADREETGADGESESDHPDGSAGRESEHWEERGGIDE